VNTLEEWQRVHNHKEVLGEEECSKRVRGVAKEIGTVEGEAEL